MVVLCHIQVFKVNFNKGGEMKKGLNYGIMILFLMISTLSYGKKITKWKLGHNANIDHIWHKTAEKFGEIVKEKTDGELIIKIYPNGQLGSETDMINSVKMGTLDIVLSGETLQNWAPKAALMAVPYAFRDLEHMKQILDGPIGDEIELEIKEKTGLIPLYYHERAPRNLTTNEEINSIEDLKGLIIRVPAVPMFVKAWQVLGAKPTPMSLQEVFTSLQQNIIQGQENPYDLIDSLGFYEVQKYVYETEHVIQWIYSLVGEKQFKKLTPKNQRAVLEASIEAQTYAEGIFVEFINTAKNNLVKKGMIIRQVKKEEFKNKIVSEMGKILNKEQFDLYNRIIEIK